MELLFIRLIACLVALYASFRFFHWCKMHELTNREYCWMFCWFALAAGSGMLVIFEMGCCVSGAFPGTTSLLSTIAAFSWPGYLVLLYYSHVAREKAIKERLEKQKRELQDERDRWGGTRWDPGEQ